MCTFVVVGSDPLLRIFSFLFARVIVSPLSLNFNLLIIKTITAFWILFVHEKRGGMVRVVLWLGVLLRKLSKNELKVVWSKVWSPKMMKLNLYSLFVAYFEDITRFPKQYFRIIIHFWSDYRGVLFSSINHQRCDRSSPLNLKREFSFLLSLCWRRVEIVSE